MLKSGAIDQISDSTGACLLSNDNNTLPILFAINTTYSCTFSTQEEYYIDTIAKGDFVFEKYANSTEAAGVSVIGNNESKNKEKVILNIIYSYAGSSSNFQNYIVGSKVTVEDG